MNVCVVLSKTKIALKEYDHALGYSLYSDYKLPLVFTVTRFPLKGTLSGRNRCVRSMVFAARVHLALPPLFYLAPPFSFPPFE